MPNDVREVFKGRVIRLTVERVMLPNGQVAPLEIVHHPGGAAVVAIDDAGTRLPASTIPSCRGRLGRRAARREAR